MTERMNASLAEKSDFDLGFEDAIEGTGSRLISAEYVEGYRKGLEFLQLRSHNESDPILRMMRARITARQI